MQAGNLRHRVTIQRQTEGAVDSLGEPACTWEPVAIDIWASVEPLSGKAFMDAKQAQSEVSHRVRLRYRDGITADMRVIHSGRRLHIDAVLNIGERNREMHLMCIERTGSDV